VTPTYGGSSRYGLVALASSLDQPGTCARTVLDAALLHQVIAGHDPCDSTSIDQPVPDVVGAARSADISGMKVGVVREFGGEGYAPGVEQRFKEAVGLLASLGAEIIEVSCPHFVYALPAYYLILPAECSSNLAKFDAMRYGLRVGDDGAASAEQVMAATREAGFGSEVKRRIIIGTYALSSGYYDAYYGQAQKVRTLISRDFDKAFPRRTCWSRRTPITAFKIRRVDTRSMYMNGLYDSSIRRQRQRLSQWVWPRRMIAGWLQVMAPLADDGCIASAGHWRRLCTRRGMALSLIGYPTLERCDDRAAVCGRTGRVRPCAGARSTRRTQHHFQNVLRLLDGIRR
jgi:aspartyl-tRNA(Asn)/glutamyl-tRNA(Gln) amidotransferase subunit A